MKPKSNDIWIWNIAFAYIFIKPLNDHIYDNTLQWWTNIIRFIYTQAINQVKFHWWASYIRSNWNSLYWPDVIKKCVRTPNLGWMVEVEDRKFYKNYEFNIRKTNLALECKKWSSKVLLRFYVKYLHKFKTNALIPYSSFSV